MNNRPVPLPFPAPVVALVCLVAALTVPAAPAPVVLRDASAFGFPDFLATFNTTSKGWIFAPPFVGLKWVELNGVLLYGNGGTNDPETGLAFGAAPVTYVISGYDWQKPDQRPARNGLCRGGIHGNRSAISMKLAVAPGHACLLEVLALGAAAQKRSMNVVVDGQTVVTNWTVVADQAANRLLRLRVVAATDTIELQLTPGSVPGSDTNPAISALALTDLAGDLWQQDPIFGRAPAGLVNIAARGIATSPDGLEQDGDGRGDQAAIDGDANTYWDEQDGAPLYRLVVAFRQPEKVDALAVMGWGQHEFAPKDFEVLCDGRVVRKVESARYTRTILFVPIEETTCRTVELKMTGCYGGSPGIRELGIFCPAQPKPPVTAPGSPLIVEENPQGTEWTVSFHGRKVLAYASAPAKFKPYVKELCTLQGVNILRDAPHDHLHHHALMFGIKANGVNFWEETPGCGFQQPVGPPAVEVGTNVQGHPQATLRQTVRWLAPQDIALPDTSQAAILVEHRTLTLTVSEPHKEVALEWNSQFQVGLKTNQVTLTGANYHGLGMRFLQDLDPLAVHRNAGGQPDLSNNKQDLSAHPWGSVFFDQPGQPATVVLFGHPSNARGNPVLFTMKTPFAYLSATQGLDREPLVYRRGDTFALRYLVALYPERKPPEALDARARAWAASTSDSGRAPAQ
jgi:hypothetical protein